MTDHDFFSVIPGFSQAAAVPVVHARELTAEMFRKQYVDKNQACLIKQAVVHWPAFGKWSNKDYWTSTCQDFGLSVYSHANFMKPERQRSGSMATTFHKAIAQLFTYDGNVFSMPSHIIDHHKGLSAVSGDITGFPFLPSPPAPRMYDRMRLFLYRGAATNWHYHSTDETLMCQVKGAKRVGLFGPHVKDIGNVTRFLLEERQLEGEKLDSALDLSPYMADVEEGDALYIPPYWHHAVVPHDLEVGFTLACCWKSPLHKLGDFSNFFVRKLYADGMWPLKKISLVIPFYAAAAAFSHYFGKRPAMGNDVVNHGRPA